MKIPTLLVIALFSLGPTTPLQAGEDLLQQFQSLIAAFNRDADAVPQLPWMGKAHEIEDVDGPIRRGQVCLSSDIQQARIAVEYAGRFRALLARDTEMAGFGERIGQSLSQSSSLLQESATLDNQLLSNARALKAIGPHGDTKAWNKLVTQGNSLSEKRDSLRSQVRALSSKRKATIGEVRNLLTKRQNAAKKDGLAKTNATTRDGGFGTTKSNPKLALAEKGTIGNNTNPGDQLKSAERHSKTAKGLSSAGAASMEARKGFDVSGRPAGSLVAAHTVSAGRFSERVQKSPEMVKELKKLGAVREKGTKLDAELNQLTSERNAEKDPDKMKKLTKKVDQKNKEKQDNSFAVYTEEQKVEQVGRKIENEVEGTPPKSSK